jgi:hypothetical protein
VQLFLTGTSTLGEIFNPAQDCADIVDQVPNAEDGFYWIILPKGTKQKVCARLDLCHVTFFNTISFILSLIKYDEAFVFEMCNLFKFLQLPYKCCDEIKNAKRKDVRQYY